MPDTVALPTPGEEYFAMETAKAFHYPGWSAWLAESPLVQAKLMAHELSKGMRDTYNLEQRQTALEQPSPGPRSPAPWDAIREKFFR